MIGTVLDGRYRIIKRLGAGGMGEVYLGEHLLLKRHEAVKILKQRFSTDEGHIARFRREARATNRVQHPNIVSFYDFGRLPNGRLYLTMEYADGPTLQAALDEHLRFESARAVALLYQLANAIQYAHSKSVIHRDLKPQNLIIVQEPGCPDKLKILDFGVAKITAPGYMETFNISAEGQLFGTPGYIAPEQIRGVRDSPSIDIYALGCIAYELITGRLPFLGSPLEVLDAHLSEIPRLPSEVQPDANIPRELDEIIIHCLAKDPGHRFTDCGEISDALGSLNLDRGSQKLRLRRATTRSDDFNEDSQAERTVVESTAVDRHDTDDSGTTDVFSARRDLELQRILRVLAESMCDLGCSDPALLVHLAEANQVEQEIEALNEQLTILKRSDELIAQKAREREASLRFALGELHFDRKDEATESGSTGKAMSALSKRLEDLQAQTQAQHAEIVEKQIDQTSLREDKVVELKRINQSIGDLINLHAPSMSSSKRITDLLKERDRLQSLSVGDVDELDDENVPTSVGLSKLSLPPLG